MENKQSIFEEKSKGKLNTVFFSVLDYKYCLWRKSKKGKYSPFDQLTFSQTCNRIYRELENIQLRRQNEDIVY